MSHEIPDVQAGFRKGRGTRDQIVNIGRIIKKASEFQKNIYFCFIDYAKAFDCVDHNKLWKILQEIGIPDCLTCLLRNLYGGQEATVSTGHGTTDWFQIQKGVCQGYVLSPCLFNFSAEYIARVQPQQDPGGTLRMNGVGERRRVRPALIGPSLQGRERKRERERVTRWGVQQGLSESGKSLSFTIAFIP